jgi:hypothetical protein
MAGGDEDDWELPPREVISPEEVRLRHEKLMADRKFGFAVKEGRTDEVLAAIREDPTRLHRGTIVADDEKDGGILTYPPMHIAAQFGHTDLVLKLHELGANPYETGMHKSESSPGSVVSLAFERNLYDAGRADQIEALLKKGLHYDPKHPERDLLAFKADVMGQYRPFTTHYYGWPSYRYDYEDEDKNIAQKDRLDEIIKILRTESAYADFAKKIPKETAKHNIINPDFIAFAKVVAIVDTEASGFKVQDDRFSISPLTPRLLANTYTDNWQKTLEKVQPITGRASGLRDAIKGFVTSVVLPELARKTEHQMRAGKINVEDAINKLMPAVADTLIANRGLQVMLDLDKDWHADFTTLEHRIRDPQFARKGNWLPLTEDYRAENGLTISFVTDAPTLEKLGKDEKNCVGGYASQCMDGPTHVGVVKEGDKVLSVFEMKESDDVRSVVTIPQHKYKATVPVTPDKPEDGMKEVGNVDVTDDMPAGKALNEFVQKLRLAPEAPGRIKIDRRRLAEHRQSIAKEANDVRYIMGFDPFSAGTRENIALQEYRRVRTGGRRADHELGPSLVKRSNSFVPGDEQWKDATAKDFLEKTGLMKVVDRVADELKTADPPPLKSRVRGGG